MINSSLIKWRKFTRVLAKRNNSAKNAESTEEIILSLNKSLTELGRNQSKLIQEIGKVLDGVTNNFSHDANAITNGINELTENYLKATQDICSKLDETKLTGATILKSTCEIDTDLKKLNEFILKLSLPLESKGRRNQLLIKIIITALGAIAILILLSIII